MTDDGLQQVVLAALQYELRRQGESDDYPGSSAAVGAPERAALCGVFDLEELAEAVCRELQRHGGGPD
ncbi:hypothetical protein ACG97_01615 [Vogesella sp. EB]|uniref:hypothetical protein n=1 Tax=Vogesella sp. EB TaxID=1526735 RepID=UPI00064D0B6B|nr:hypothetical protein [Vogesella sp. EB]KMJ54486.1 hypothetical protein ACG97_01615 [Vogesella sp. EB]